MCVCVWPGPRSRSVCVCVMMMCNTPCDPLDTQNNHRAATTSSTVNLLVARTTRKTRHTCSAISSTLPPHRPLPPAAAAAVVARSLFRCTRTCAFRMQIKTYILKYCQACAARKRLADWGKKPHDIVCGQNYYAFFNNNRFIAAAWSRKRTVVLLVPGLVSRALAHVHKHTRGHMLTTSTHTLHIDKVMLATNSPTNSLDCRHRDDDDDDGDGLVKSLNRRFTRWRVCGVCVYIYCALCVWL